MIVSLHVATGAAIGEAAGARRTAVPLALLAHFLGDVMPHRDLPSRRFEIGSGLVALALVAASRGPLAPATLAAAACAAPDLEHLLPLDRGLFPSHRWSRFHTTGGVSGPAQLLAAGALVAWVAARANRH